MAAVFGAAGFVGGRGTADVDGAFDHGWAAGEASTRRAANARYGEGGEGREAIRREAWAVGRRAGLRVGRRKGFAAGRRAGMDKGAQAIFAGFDGGWDPGRWYAVRIAHGEGVRGYAISSRVALGARRAYRLCGGSVCSAAMRAAPVRPASVASGGAAAPSERR
ncbi:MAG TPA: hypothetical protein VGW10_10395 [Solirubrobacteraceae bacterium]|nr:hypothetical protein [Solirubrobacteraceae bacterium]